MYSLQLAALHRSLVHSSRTPGIQLRSDQSNKIVCRSRHAFLAGSEGVGNIAVPHRSRPCCWNARASRPCYISSQLFSTRRRASSTSLNDDPRTTRSEQGAEVIEYRAIDTVPTDQDNKVSQHAFQGRATLYTSSSDDSEKGNSRSWMKRIIQSNKQDEAQPLSSGSSNDICNNMTSSSFYSSWLYKNIISHFLPAHYPTSVSEGYARFSIFSFCASIAGSAGMVLSTQTLLLAVGVVGTNSSAASTTAAATAPVMAGALNWVLKDGMGQLGGVIFASRMGTTKRFDSNPKKWRMVAALSLDTAALLEILSPFCWNSSWVLPLACTANILKNIGFLTASASRAALHQSLACSHNLADVTAKAGSQSMAAGLAGTAVGIGLSTTVLAHDAQNFAIGFFFLAIVHEVCNYASLQSIALTSLNTQRLHILLKDYIIQGKGRVNDTDPAVLSPKQVAQQEAYFPWSRENGDASHGWLTLGCRLEQICPNGVDEWNKLRECLRSTSKDSSSPSNAPYLINVLAQGEDRRSSSPSSSRKIHLVFLHSAAGEDLLLAMLHAYLLKREIEHLGNKPISSVDVHPIISRTYQQALVQFPAMLESMRTQGWQTDAHSINLESSKSFRIAVVR